jgi:hypothetical protein
VLSALIERIKLRYPPRETVASTALADRFLSTFEGACAISKSLHEPDVTTQQLRLYQTFIKALFNS